MLNLVWKSQKIVMEDAKETFVFLFGGMWRFKNQKLLLVGVLTLSQKTLSDRVDEQEEVVFKVEGTCHSKRKKKKHRGRKHTHCYCHTSTVLFVSFNFSIRNGLLFHSGHLRVERAGYRIHTCGLSVEVSTNRFILDFSHSTLAPRLHTCWSELFLVDHAAPECMFSNPEARQWHYSVLAEVEQVRLHVHIHMYTVYRVCPPVSL